MPATLYEQFFAVGSVKSLLTGKEFNSPRPSRNAASTSKEKTDASSKEKTPPLTPANPARPEFNDIFPLNKTKRI